MSDDLRTNCLYIGGALAILLILMIIIRLCSSRTIRNKSNNDTNMLLVNTEKGLVRSSNHLIASELERVKALMLRGAAGAQDSCDDLTPLINNAMQNLAEFIQKNPELDSTDLCSLELKTDLVNQYMSESIDPNPNEYSTSYKSLLNWEEYERELPANAEERLIFLIKNLDIAIKLLRSEVCNNGQLDLSRLYKILVLLNKQICMTGGRSSSLIPYQEPDTYTRYDKPPPLPLFLKDPNSIEPFESRAVTPRSRARKGSFAKLNTKMSNNDTHPSIQLSNNTLKGMKSALISTDRIAPLSEDGFADYTTLPKEIEVGNYSFEGSVERDILGYKPPGHMIAQMYDPTENFTVLVGACGGKTVPDSHFYQECTGQDLEKINALHGDPRQMLDCIGGCDEEPNYFRWYNKLANSNAGHDSLGVEYYETPMMDISSGRSHI